MVDKSHQRQFDFLCEKLTHEYHSRKIMELVKQIRELLGDEGRLGQEEEEYVHLPALYRYRKSA